jgi:hypothetical protein
MFPQVREMPSLTCAGACAGGRKQEEGRSGQRNLRGAKQYLDANRERACSSELHLNSRGRCRTCNIAFQKVVWSRLRMRGERQHLSWLFCRTLTPFPNLEVPGPRSAARARCSSFES